MLISTPLIFSGNLMSGQVGRVHLASGTLLVQSGDISSGSVHGFFGPTREIASGTVGVFDFGSGAVVAGTVGSGAIVSGNIASGQAGHFHLAAKAAQSGQVGSGAIIGGWISGLSESIASGTIGPVDLASGTIFAGAGIGVTVALSGITISNLSGGGGGGNQASGIPVTHAQDLVPFFSGSVWTILTEETISGIRAVCISQSGNLRVAMASVSGRMPAMGVVWDNVLSGIQANVYTDGVVQATSGLVDYSGQLGLWLTVGRSGHVTRVSGSWSSGGFLSGDIIQRVGIVRNSGSFAARIAPWTIMRASG